MKKHIYKLLIIPIILISLFTLNVNAEAVKINLSDLTYNGKDLLNLDWYTIPSGNRTVFFDYDFNNTNENANVLFNSLVLCSDAQYTSAYAVDPSEVVNIQMNNTNYSCNYSNSSYGGGKVVIITFVTYSSGSNSIVLYQNANASIQLIDFVVDSSSYVNPMNYSSQSLINQNSQIINQNNTIINNQNDIKNNTDKIKDTITSDDDDTTSSKCGILCKLKGIFTGITELPNKIGNLFIPTNDQLYEIVNDSKELSENFGFVGQSVNYFVTMFSNLVGLVTSNGCVEFPGFKISKTTLFDEHVFWEARNVCLSDNVILSENITQIRFITSTVLICLFISFASDMFFKILSKNESYRTSADVDSIGGAQ